MNKILCFFSIIFFIACGEIDQNVDSKNINSRFYVSKLSDLSQSEIRITSTLCSDLVEKLATLQTRYMTKFFNYESSIKECGIQDTVSKNLSLTLDNSADSLKFLASNDSNFAFLRPELIDQYGSFAAFCSNTQSEQRYVQVSSNEVKHFTIKESSNDFEVEILSSFYNETINNDIEYKVYKSETITYTKNELSNLPKAMAINRIVETSSGCDGNETYLKESTLKSIRD
jgi:hypothetical protein